MRNEPLPSADRNLCLTGRSTSCSRSALLVLGNGYDHALQHQKWTMRNVESPFTTP